MNSIIKLMNIEKLETVLQRLKEWYNGTEKNCLLQPVPLYHRMGMTTGTKK